MCNVQFLFKVQPNKQLILKDSSNHAVFNKEDGQWGCLTLKYLTDDRTYDVHWMWWSSSSHSVNARIVFAFATGNVNLERQTPPLKRYFGKNKTKMPVISKLDIEIKTIFRINFNVSQFGNKCLKRFLWVGKKSVHLKLKGETILPVDIIYLSLRKLTPHSHTDIMYVNPRFTGPSAFLSHHRYNQHDNFQDKIPASASWPCSWRVYFSPWRVCTPCWNNWRCIFAVLIVSTVENNNHLTFLLFFLELNLKLTSTSLFPNAAY